MKTFLRILTNLIWTLILTALFLVGCVGVATVLAALWTGNVLGLIFAAAVTLSMVCLYRTVDRALSRL